MKKTLSAFLVIIMLFGTAWAQEPPTRAEFSVQLANALELQLSTMFPLLRYNDWSQIGLDRLLIAAVIRDGIFAPDDNMLQPNKTIDQADIDTAIFGMLRYVAANEQFVHFQGTVMATVDDIITLQIGAKKFIAKGTCLYIGDNLSTFSSLKTAQKIEFITNMQGKVLLGWDPKISSKIITTVETGALYLYDEQNESLIMTNVKGYRDGKWIETTQNRYANVKLSPSALIVCEGKKVRRNEINQSFLDRQISLVIGGALDSQNILYVKIH